MTLTGLGAPEQVEGEFVSSNLFPLLGVEPVLGQTFSPDQEEQREKVVILSYGLWQHRFGGASDVIGKSLNIDGDQNARKEGPRAPRIIGVMPAGFYFPDKETQLWEALNAFCLPPPIDGGRFPLGREIGPQDTPASAKVAVVNEAFTKAFLNGENPVGRCFGFGDDQNNSGDIEIVGVIGDVKYESAKDKPFPAAYRPILQVQDEGAYSSNLEIRTESDPLAAASNVRSAIAQVDDKLPVVGVTSFSKQLADSLRQE